MQGPDNRSLDAASEHRRLADLQHLLRAHRPYDAAEAAFRDQMLALTAVAGDPLHRKHFAPGHFTASAFVLSPDGQAMLLILHGKLGRWLQPGGHIDPGDPDIAAAARREVAEEVGLAEVLPDERWPGAFDLDIHPIPARTSGPVERHEPAHAHYDVRFLWRAPSLEMRAGSDAAAARWVPLADVAAVGTDASVLRALAKLQT